MEILPPPQKCVRYRKGLGFLIIKIVISSHGQTFDPLHFGYTFSTLLGRQIKGRGRGHQPFPNKMKFRWPKVPGRPPLKRVVCWVVYPF